MIPFLLTALLSFYSLAVDPQGGNGGNVCELESDSTDELRPVEEAYFKFSPYKPFQTYLPTFIPTLENKLLLYDLEKSDAGKEVTQIIEQIQMKSPILGAVMIDHLHMLSMTYGLLTDEFSSYNNIDPKDLNYCKPGTMVSAIILLSSGIYSIPLFHWNSLSLKSQVILILHEIFRIDQVFGGFLEVYTNADLYRLTHIAYESRSNPELLTVRFKQLENKKTKSFNYSVPLEEEKRSLAKLLLNIDSYIAQGKFENVSSLIFEREKRLEVLRFREEGVFNPNLSKQLLNLWSTEAFKKYASGEVHKIL